MRTRFYTTSVHAWRAMLASIRHARKSIYLEMYVFEDNTPGFDFVSALEEQGRAGVRIILVLDAFGSSKLSAEGIRRLRAAGAEVLFFSYWFRRTHRKLLIIDEKAVFLGGVNISHDYTHWHDLHMKLSGRVVPPIVRSFARVYRASGGTDRVLHERGRHFPILRRARMWFVEHGLGESSKYALRTQYEEYIDAAKESIVLVTPIFIPTHWLIASLHRALDRGVKITLLLPLNAQYHYIGRLNRYHAIIFGKLGAQCLFSRTLNHAKVMLVDGTVATVGSQNLDSLSFIWNVESGVFFDKPEMIRDLMRILALWKQDAVPLTHLRADRRWYDHLFLLSLRVIGSVL
jgi:cardiolipin synthase